MATPTKMVDPPKPDAQSKSRVKIRHDLHTYAVFVAIMVCVLTTVVFQQIL